LVERGEWTTICNCSFGVGTLVTAKSGQYTYHAPPLALPLRMLSIPSSRYRAVTILLKSHSFIFCYPVVVAPSL